MAKKKIRFTNKATNESNDLLFGGLGHEVYSLTKSISEMNDAIRWCNHHEVGEKFDCDKYSIEIIGMD